MFLCPYYSFTSTLTYFPGHNAKTNSQMLYIRENVIFEYGLSFCLVSFSFVWLGYKDSSWVEDMVFVDTSSTWCSLLGSTDLSSYHWVLDCKRKHTDRWYKKHIQASIVSSCQQRPLARKGKYFCFPLLWSFVCWSAGFVFRCMNENPFWSLSHCTMV